MAKKPIYVTRPSLPPLDDFVTSLENIWQSRVLTNGGEYHQALEKALASYLGVEFLCLFNNGTNALLAALEALELSVIGVNPVPGEVITTPFTFVATTSAIVRSGLVPVFVDIDPATMNIDSSKIEAAITENTVAILPVHCYGGPCEVDKIAAIAARYQLKVIYDAAHAFGVKDGGGSITRHGDLSIISFHATKVFNTIEGGAIVCHSEEQKQKIDLLKNFGIAGETTVTEVGLNGKMNELQAAFGLLQLQSIDQQLQERRGAACHYRQRLSAVKGISCLPMANVEEENGAYFPILVEKSFGLSRDDLNKKLNAAGIYPRRYFYPLVSDMPLYAPFVGDAVCLDVAACCSERILCLPIFSEMSPQLVDEIVNLIKA